MWEQWDALVQIRISELDLYWTRFSALLVVNGGALALFRWWSTLGSECSWEPIAVALFGAVVAVVSTRILRGSHFWVRWWEDRLLELEERLRDSNPDMVTLFTKHPHYLERGSGKKHISTFTNATRIMYVIVLAWAVLLSHAVYAVVATSPGPL